MEAGSVVWFTLSTSLLPPRIVGLDQSEMIRLHLGCTFVYELPVPVPALLQVAIRRDGEAVVRHEAWDVRPAVELTELSDPYGNTLRRVALPPGEVHIGYDAVVDVSDQPDEMDAGAKQHPIEALPAGALHFLLASRYCESDELGPAALELFAGTAPGWPRVQAISDWVHGSLRFESGSSDQATSAVDVYRRQRGVCRDFAHLFIAFCRAMNIPARYVFGYLPDLFVPPAPDPMDFCAWAEVYLGGRWWTFDPRNNQRRVGRVVVGRGQDAVDVAMITTWGPAQLRSLRVWADEAAP
jgi:transglutaminase-like putative cysteine protease